MVLLYQMLCVTQMHLRVHCFPLLVNSLGPKNFQGTKYGHCIFKSTVINILFFLSLKGSNFGYR